MRSLALIIILAIGLNSFGQTKGIKFLEMSREREKVTACSIDNSNTIDISGE